MALRLVERREKGTGCVYKDKNSGIYYHTVTINGKQIKKSLKTRNKKEAYANAKELMPILMATTKAEMAVQIAQAKQLAVCGNVLIDEAWKKYLHKPTRPQSSEGTLSNYKRMWEKFKDWLKNEYPALKSLSQINQNMALEYCTFLDVEGNSASTYNYHIQAVSLVIRILSVDAGIVDNPFQKVQKQKVVSHKRQPFTELEIKKMFDYFEDDSLQLPYKDEMEILFYLACWTSLRQIDCANLEWSDINMKRKMIATVPIKTKKQSGQKVFIPIHPRLQIALEKAEKWKKNKLVLPKLAQIYKIRRSDITKWSKRVFEYIGLETTIAIPEGEKRKRKINKYGVHSFRHSFVSFLAEVGVPVSVVQAIVGHRSSLMTQYYSHIGDKALRNAIDSLPDMGFKSIEEDSVNDLFQELKSKKDLTEEEAEILKIMEVHRNQ